MNDRSDRRALSWYVENLTTFPDQAAIAIRRATLADREGIAKTHVDSIRGVAISHYPTEQITAWSAGKKPEHYPVEAEEMYVGVRGNEVVGFGELHLKTGEVRAVYVSSTAAGQGVGTQILATLEDVARRHGIAKLHLSASLNAVPFYQRHGYVELRRDKKLMVGGTSLSYVSMEKALTAKTE